MLEIVGLEVMAEGVREGAHSEGRKERIPDCRSCNADTAAPNVIISLPIVSHRVLLVGIH